MPILRCNIEGACPIIQANVHQLLVRSFQVVSFHQDLYHLKVAVLSRHKEWGSSTLHALSDACPILQQQLDSVFLVVLCCNQNWSCSIVGLEISIRSGIQQQLQCLHAPLLSSYVSWGSATFRPLIDAGLLLKKVLDNLLVVVPRHAEQKDLKRKIPVRWTLGQAELGNSLLSFVLSCSLSVECTY